MQQPIVLIISGNQAQMNQIYIPCKEAGFQVFMTNQGESVPAILAQMHPQLVLLDWDLPDLSALAVIRAIRCQMGFTKLPIILTGREISCENKILALEAGVDYCQDGLVYPKELMARVRALLRRVDSSDHADPARHKSSGSSH